MQQKININTEKKNQTEKNTESPNSHTLFGSMMKEALIPLNLEVESNYEVGKGPPKLDVLIIRRTGDSWTDEQLDFLPDGIRQKKCRYVILELKYTESINQIAIFQTLGYFGSYLKIKGISIDDACTFLVSAKTPNNKTLSKLNFEKKQIKGVYEPKVDILKPLSLITLNDLSDKNYNLWIKLFSSKKKQKLSVLQKILSLDLKKISQELIVILFKIMNFWNKTGEVSMQTIKKEINSEFLNGIDEDLVNFFLSFTKPELVARQLKPEERLMGLKPEDVIPRFKPEDRLMGLKPEDRLMGLKPEDRLMGLKPEDRLNGIDIETIEKYLERKKSQIKKRTK
ncbi:hypothetical protein MHK_001298 [Candidatus Magnetomorum sp. HK-1]|nr:hypothetical protein MHK_001298 [Candidatus Magnetomorum sp. HK-1]